MRNGLLYMDRKGKKMDMDFYFRCKEMEDLLSTLDMDLRLLDFTVRTPNSKTYFSEPKIEEIKKILETGKFFDDPYTVLVLDINLTGTQVANLREILGIEIIDKTMLILKIFEMHAFSHEAKLQVEIAKLQYESTQLVHSDADYSQVTSGSGKNKGSGEKEKELEKRRIRRTIYLKKKELEEIKKARKTLRTKRTQRDLPIVAIVGYTNAGKSSLMNLLLKANKSKQDKYVLAENRLFATLDTSTRLIDVYSYPSFLITDTVGFLRDLPHSLITSFKSTLEEISDADLIIEVVDITDPCYLEKMETTRLTLNELGCEKIKKITFFNKYDLGNIQLKRLLTKDELFTVCIGDESNEKEIIEFIVDKLTTKWKKHTFFIPYGENYYEFYKSAYVIKVIEKENGLEFLARINPKSFDKFSIYLRIKDS